MLADLSDGGNTGLHHESTAAIDLAAYWLASQLPQGRPQAPVSEVRSRFGPDAISALQATREAILVRRAPL